MYPPSVGLENTEEEEGRKIVKDRSLGGWGKAEFKTFVLMCS